MAKSKVIKVRLKSTESGYFYVTRRNTSKTNKLEKRKYDPHVRKHVLFVEKKI